MGDRRSSIGSQKNRIQSTMTRIKKSKSSLKNMVTNISNHDFEKEDRIRQIKRGILSRESETSTDERLLFDDYRYCVSQQLDWRTKNVTQKKARYVFGEMIADLGLKRWKSKDFQITLFIVLMTFWMRMYLHYFG